MEELLEVFFASHDATARTATAQYESAIWPQSEEQAEKVKAYVERYGLEQVLSEMVNDVVQSGTPTPLHHMAAYLSRRAEGPPP